MKPINIKFIFNWFYKYFIKLKYFKHILITKTIERWLTTQTQFKLFNNNNNYINYERNCELFNHR